MLGFVVLVGALGITVAIAAVMSSQRSAGRRFGRFAL